MPLSPALVERSFDAAQARAVDVAFGRACHALGLSEIPDRLTDIIASKIAEMAQSGESDPDRLYEAVMHWVSAE